MRLHPPLFLIVALAAVVLAVSCGQARNGNETSSVDSATDDPWAVVEAAFLDVCTASASATEAGSGVADYCRCAYEETVEFYGTPEAFTEAGVLGTGRALVIDPLLEPGFGGCADLHLR